METVKTKVKNDAGEFIELNKFEARIAELNQKKLNDLGFEIDVTTMTGVSKKVSGQKFYEIPFAEYLPVKVGENPYSSKILHYREFATGGDFEAGIINSAKGKGLLAQMDAGVDSLTAPTRAWAKEISWTHFELAEASRAGNWDIVSAKERSRKKNWDLGTQRLAFLGLNGDSSMLGLFSQSGITTNTTRIVQNISGLAPTDLKAFLAGILDDYRSNCSRTAWPTHFVLPESDYLGLAAPASADFPINVTLELLEKMFRIMTGVSDFKILPCKYADHGDTDAAHATKQTYALYNGKDEDSLVLDIPVQYQNTLANTVDGFRYQNVGFGQVGSVLAIRPKEMLYFQFTP